MRITTKLHQAVEMSIALFPHKGQYLERQMFVIGELTRPTKEQMKEISIHLKAMSMLSSNQGTDSSLQEKHQFEIVERYHMNEIRQIHEGYFWTIKIQSNG